MGQKIDSNLFRASQTNNFLSNWSESNYSTYKELLKNDYFLRNYIEKKFLNWLQIFKIKISRIISPNSLYHWIFISFSISRPNIQKIKSKLFKYLLSSLNSKNKKFIIFLKKQEENTNSKKKILLISKILSFYFIKIIKHKIFNCLLLLQNIDKKKNLFYNKNFKTIYKINILKSVKDFLFLNIIEIIKLALQLRRISIRRIFNYIFQEIPKYYSLDGLKLQFSGRLDNNDRAKKEIDQIGAIPISSYSSNILFHSYYIKTVTGIIGIKIWVYFKL